MWTLVAIVAVAWLLWMVAGLLALEADKLRRKRPADAAFSVLPVIPLFPLLFLGLSYLLDKFVPPWGTRIVAGLHLILIAVFIVGIIYEWRRIRSLGPPSA